MRDKLVMVGGLALAVLVVGLLVLGSKKSDREVSIWSVGTNNNGAVQAQVIGGSNVAVIGGTQQMAAGAAKSLRFPAISQRDKSQYANEQEWRTWAGSACSAAAISAVLNGYGKSVRVTDVLAYLQSQNAIKAGAGLYRYDVFETVAAKYGLKATYSDDKNTDSHFERVLGYLKSGYPVILNVLDPNYFPAGHFIVATGVNDDGTIAILNPDPTSDKSVAQNWPAEGLKLYFSRMNRSAAIMP